MTQRLKQPKQTAQTKPSLPTEQTFLEHVYELRKRLFWVVLAIVVASAAGLQYKDWLIGAVMAPLHGEKLVYLTPAGGFSFIFTLSIYFGVLLSIPVIIYNVYRFIEPLLGRASRRFVASFILISIGLAAAGAAFGYFVTIPAALNFLSNFAGSSVSANLTADSYLSFVVSYVLGLAALFQVPLLLFLFDHVHHIPPGLLSGSQRFVIIAATVIAALITPTPDAFNMMVVAIPLIAIYEVGVLAVFMRRLGRDRGKAKQAVKTPVVAEVRCEAVLAQEQPETSQSSLQPLTAAIEQEQNVPVQAQAPQPQRSMDGFVRTRKPTPNVQVPARNNQAARLAESRQTSSRPLRSIDGLVYVSKY